jgi:hypothetical protein
MDHEFDEAVRTLAEVQIRHGVRSILLSIQEPDGDVIASVARSPGRSFALYARVHRGTKTMARFRLAE